MADPLLLQHTVIKEQIITSLKQFPVVALLGPRQSGKTTFARQIFGDAVTTKQAAVNYLDLEKSIGTFTSRRTSTHFRGA